MKFFGSSGIRGPFGTKITPQLVNEIGQAVGTVYKKVVIGWDARTTSELLSQALASGLMTAGADVGIVGLVSTPTLAHATKGYDAGIMITASHNPPTDNGLKFWNPDGSSFDSGQMVEVEDILLEGKAVNAGWNNVGHIFRIEDATEKHIQAIEGHIGQLSGKVVVDCGNGAASKITPYLLRRLGCDVIAINAHPDGTFPGRESEPTEENTKLLAELVKSSCAMLGIAHDGDGDRMVAVDEKGRFASGDTLLPIFAKMVGKSSIVVPLNVSMGVDRYVPGVKVVRCKVGDVYVSEKIKEVNADFGGEESGTWVFPENSYCPDGPFAAAKLVQIVSRRPLSEYIDEIPHFNLYRKRIPYGDQPKDKMMARVHELMKAWNPIETTDMDGVHARFEDGWVLMRPSGTEPKLKITVEAENEARMSQLVEMSIAAAKAAIPGSLLPNEGKPEAALPLENKPEAEI